MSGRVARGPAAAKPITTELNRPMPIHQEYFGQVRPEMHEFIPVRRHTVLEIGCGEGRFSTSIQGVKELWGVEPDANSAAIAATHMHAVHRGLYEMSNASCRIAILTSSYAMM